MLISYHRKTFNYTPWSRPYRKHLHPTSTASVYVTSVTSWLNPSSWTSSRFHGTFSMGRLVIATGNFQRMLQVLHYYWSFEGTRAVTWITGALGNSGAPYFCRIFISSSIHIALSCEKDAFVRERSAVNRKPGLIRGWMGSPVHRPPVEYNTCCPNFTSFFSLIFFSLLFTWLFHEKLKWKVNDVQLSSTVLDLGIIMFGDRRSVALFGAMIRLFPAWWNSTDFKAGNVARVPSRKYCPRRILLFLFFLIFLFISSCSSFARRCEHKGSGCYTLLLSIF